LGIRPEIYGTKKQGAMGLASMVAAGLVLGGLIGSPLLAIGYILKKAWQKVFGSDIEEDSKAYLQETFGLSKKQSEFAVRLSWRGLPAAALGIDFSNRVAPNLPFTNLPPGELRWQDLIGAGLGAASIPLQKGFMVATALQQGAPGRALEYAAPTALQNLLAAKRLGGEGATTLSGRPIFTAEGKPLILTPQETGKKALGFQPIRLAENYRKEQHAREMERIRKRVAQDFAGSLARAIRDQDDEAFDKTIDAWVDYNNQMLKAGRLADVISPQSIHQSVINRFKPKYPDVSEKKMLLRQPGR